MKAAQANKREGQQRSYRKLVQKWQKSGCLTTVEFEFNSDRVYIRRDEAGNLILSLKPANPDNGDDVLKLVSKAQVNDAF
ncbi:antitoxin [Duffyella gerundensis]|uniref:antitoxin n=1 Tax=Duffyella TaxID=3026546 RepID=UPI003F6E2A56